MSQEQKFIEKYFDTIFIYGFMLVVGVLVPPFGLMFIAWIIIAYAQDHFEKIKREERARGRREALEEMDDQR